METTDPFIHKTNEINNLHKQAESLQRNIKHLNAEIERLKRKRDKLSEVKMKKHTNSNAQIEIFNVIISEDPKDLILQY
jgi:prefoldin subunit 5